jgi:hypothetical protein
VVAVLQVHAYEHLGPVLRLGAARASLDVDEAVVRVERVGEHPPELERCDVLFEPRRFAPERFEGRRVLVCRGELEQLVGIGNATFDAIERFDDRVENLFLLAEFLRALRVVPQLGVFELAVQYVETRLFRLVVKDTSAARRSAWRDPRATKRFG